MFCVQTGRIQSYGHLRMLCVEVSGNILLKVEKNKKSESNYSLSIPPEKCDKNLPCYHVMSEKKLSHRTGSRQLAVLNLVRTPTKVAVMHGR